MEPMFEQHYSVTKLSKLWGFSDETIRRWFKDEPGVLRAGAEQPAAGARVSIEIRIPESVARRVYQKRVVKAEAA